MLRILFSFFKLGVLLLLFGGRRVGDGAREETPFGCSFLSSFGERERIELFT
jgi:hypothetical protein